MSLSIKISKKKILMIALMFIYRIILDIIYVIYINPVYEYEGFYLDLNLLKIVESYLLGIIIDIFLPINEGKPSSIALNVLNIIMLTPLFSIYSLKNESRIYMYGIVISFLTTIMLIKIIPNLKIQIKFSINKLIYFIIMIITVLIFATLIYLNGVPTLELLDFRKVYTVRGKVNYGLNIMEYLVHWQATVINIFLIIVFLMDKKYLRLIIMCLLQLLLYLITSHKVYFFYPIVIAFIMYFIKRRKFIIASIYGTIFIIITSSILYFMNISEMIPAMTVNRVLFLPAQISFQYYEFFSNNQFVFLSHSIFKKLFSQPVYDLHPIKIIGNIYYNNNWPNTGYLGDAYMNFGIFGMIIFSILLGFILKLIDSLSNSDDKLLISNIFVVIYMFLLTNGALLTTLFYGGMLLLLLLLLTYSTYNYNKLCIDKSNV